MKMRMFAVLLIAVLLLGSVCGCDDVVDTTNDSVSTTATIDDAETTAATTKPTTTTTAKKITTQTPTAAEQMVWIPVSGSKYHGKSSCSNMKNPSKVTKSCAIETGYSPCKKCY